jgi:hypothetical protein
VAQSVYRQIPSLPLENQYRRAENNQQAVDSTLVSRLLLYHTKVKGRLPLQRLDWKITLADYLGVNEFLQAETYPGHGFLKTNPMERDRTLIQSLNHAQRNALVQALVNSFSSPTGAVAPPPNAPATSTAPSRPKSVAQPILPPLATPGSADLLKPAVSPPPSSSGESQFLRP